MSIALNRFDDLEDTDLLACTDTDGITYSVTGAQFKKLFEVLELEPLTLVEDPTIEVSGLVYSVATGSVVTGGKPTYTYENEWFGTGLNAVQNQYKSYNIGINNKGQAVAPTAVIATIPLPRNAFYTTVNSGKRWVSVPHDSNPAWGSKGNIVWDDEHECFICGSLLNSSTATVHQDEGVRIVYPKNPLKNTFVHLDLYYDLADRSQLERLYDVRKHPTLDDTYTVCTSGLTVTGNPQQTETILVFTIDFDTMTGEVIDSLGPVRPNGGDFGRSHREHNGVGYFVTANYAPEKDQIFVNPQGLYSKTGTWTGYDYPRDIEYGEVCFIENDVFVSSVEGSSTSVYKFNIASGTFTRVTNNEFWRQIGDYVYKASKTGVDKVSTADGSSITVATYTQQIRSPMFVESAGGDIAVIFSDGKIMFTDSSAVLGTGESIVSNETVTLKQTVTDRNGDFVVGSATAEPPP